MERAFLWAFAGLVLFFSIDCERLMNDRSLFEVIRSYLHRRLVFPLAVAAMMVTGGLAAWRLYGLEREHFTIAWGLDNYVSEFLASADETLRLMAQLSQYLKVDTEAAWAESVQVYHRVFLVRPESYAVFVRGHDIAPAGSLAPPPASLFPETTTWPLYSVPYYRSDLGSVTMATMIPGAWGSIIGELNLDRLQRLIAAYLHKVPRRIVWITDRYGNLIVHPDGRLVQEQENVAHDPLVRKALNNPQGVKLFGRLGDTAVYGISWRIEPWGWVVIVAYPLGAALIPVLGGAAVGFFVFFAFLRIVFFGLLGELQKDIVGPMQVLGREAQRLAEGSRAKTDPWPDMNGTFAELAVFSRQFQEMGRAVQDREEALVRRQAELLRAQEARKRSEGKYREILESIEEAYFEVNTHGIVTFHNTAFLRLMGLDGSPNPPLSLHDLADPETARALEAFLEKVAAGQDRGELKTFVFHDHLGTPKTVEVSVRPVSERDGPVRGFRLMARDITAKVEAEKRAQELERVLGHAQKMESLGTLASGIAHEFNNLLQAMTGYLELLANHTDPSDRRQHWIGRVREAADRGAELVRRMLTFARQDEMRPENLDLNQLVRETLDFLRRNIPRMIQLEAHLSPEIPAVFGDRLQLEQIIINLVVNARDAIAEGSPGRITVCTRPEKRPEGTEVVVLEVSDTGQGIPASIRDRIFDPFFTTKEPGKGTGLGLSTVYGIVQRHGGSVTCDSAPGKGTTFRITFPVKGHGEDVPTKPGEKRSGEERPRPFSLENFRVLVVDDEPALLEFVAESLEAERLQVLKAFSGEEALHVLEKEGGRLNAIVLDLHMPGMGGKACYKEIRRLYPKIPIIVTSDYADADLSQSVGEAEHVTVLAKPYRIADLLVGLMQSQTAFP